MNLVFNIISGILILTFLVIGFKYLATFSTYKLYKPYKWEDAIKNDLVNLETNGFDLINKEPVSGSDNMQIAFIKPKSTGGVLTEICQH